MTTPEQLSSEEQAKIATACKDNPDLPKELVKQAIKAQAEKQAGLLADYEFEEPRS